MTLAPCPQCGTQTTPGLACVSCGTPTPAPATNDHAPQFGQWEVILGKLRGVAAPKYIVKSILGYGGMAGVYLAEEPRLGRKVAIKVMAPGLMVDPKLVERFMQEARTIAQLSHPNIVTIYDVDEREDLHWFAMTFVGGRTLGQVMSESVQPLSVSVVRAWLYQIGDALGFAHNQGIVHRDIKPGNVLLDVRGNALVTDFGIAKVADAESGLTRTGMLVGTPAYMSPEQCSSGAITGASDQYALGAVAYQMLTGQPPFVGPTLSVLQAHVAQEPTPLLELRPDCPVELAGAIERMLYKQPEDRWPTLSAALAAAGAAPPGLDGPVREELELHAAHASGITVAPWSTAAREGTRQALQVLIVDESGRVLPGRQVEWRSSQPFTAAVTADGAFAALSPGATHIMGVSGSATVSLAVTIEPDPVQSVEIVPAEKTILVSEQCTLDAMVRDLDGTRLDDRAVLWTSSDPNIAQVSPAGVIEGFSAGRATVTATTGGKSANVVVVVNRAAAVPRGTLAAGTSQATMQASALRATTARSTPGLRAVAKPPAAQQPTLAKTGRSPVVPVVMGVAVIGSVALAIVRPWQRNEAGSTPDTVPAGISELPAVAPAAGDAPVQASATTSVGAAPQEPVQQPSAPGGGASQPQQPVQVAAEAVVEITGNLPDRATITVTDAFGRARAVSGRTVRLEPGTYALEFRAPGYESDRQTFTLRAGENEIWGPSIRAVVAPVTPAQQPPVQTPPQTTPTQPARDIRADQEAIRAEVNRFVAAFGNKDVNTVVPLLPREAGAGWRQLFTSRDVRNFRTVLTRMDDPRVEPNDATVRFTTAISYRDQNQGNVDQPFNWIASLDRITAGWRITIVRQVTN